MLDEVESFISGLRNGDKKLNLVRLNDDKFQNKMKQGMSISIVLRSVLGKPCQKSSLSDVMAVKERMKEESEQKYVYQ